MSFLYNSNISVVGNVEIVNDTGNPIPVIGNVNAAITGGSVTVVNGAFNPVLISPADGSGDAFGRLRTSDMFTLGDYKHTYGLNPDFLEHIENGGNVVHVTNLSCARLSTSTNSASRAIHQTKLYHNYMPGKGQLILSSFVFYAATSNVTKRTGYFDDLNGIFFEQAGDGTLSWNIRSNTSGSAVDNKIVQSSWNIDTLSGAGGSSNPSELQLDITKTQLAFIDFQWLGVGAVRVGFAHNGAFIPVHQFDHSNLLNTVYMSNPNLPVRCEIRNNGATTGDYMDQICATVISEGGYIDSGYDRAINNPVLRTITSGSDLPVLAIRLKSNFNSYPNRISAKMLEISIFSSAENVTYELVKIPNSANITVGGGGWSSAYSDSAIEFTSNATAFSTTYADVLNTGYCQAAGVNGNKISGSAGGGAGNGKKNFIAQNFDSTDSEIMLIHVLNQGTKSTDVGVSVQWREVY